MPIKWNNLSKKEVEASSTSVFKKEYDLAEPSRILLDIPATVLEIKSFSGHLGFFILFLSEKKVRHGNGLLQAFKLRQLVLFTEL